MEIKWSLLTKGEDIIAWDYNKEFLNTIKEYCEVPKVKTEIPIQLVLKSFIEEVLNTPSLNLDVASKMTYVSVEFPLK